MEPKQKAILDLCRELPDAAAEAELRARAGEFTSAICSQIFDWRGVQNQSELLVNARTRENEKETVFYFDGGSSGTLTVYAPDGGSFQFNPADRIADAKAATDAIAARAGVWFICGFDGARWRVKLHSEEDGWEAEVAASTEQLARAACALLAAEAMRKEMR